MPVDWVKYDRVIFSYYFAHPHEPSKSDYDFLASKIPEATSGGVGKRVSRLRIEAKKTWPDQFTYVPTGEDTAQSSPAITPANTPKKGNAKVKKDVKTGGNQIGHGDSESTPNKGSKKRARHASHDDSDGGNVSKSTKMKAGDTPSSAVKEEFVKKESEDDSEV